MNTIITQQNVVQQGDLSNNSVPGINWRDTPYVVGLTDYNIIEEEDIDTTKISWLGTKASLTDTPQEQLETRLATLEQVKLGILDQLGLPTGFTYDELGISKDMQEQIKAKKAAMASANGTPVVQEKPTFNNKYERKAWREQERIRQKDAEKKSRLAAANNKIASHQTNVGNYKKFGIQSTNGEINLRKG